MAIFVCLLSTILKAVRMVLACFMSISYVLSCTDRLIAFLSVFVYKHTLLYLDMEDEHIQKLCVNDEKDLHFFAVYDGHGGSGAAKYAAKNLHTCVLDHPAFRECNIKNTAII